MATTAAPAATNVSMSATTNTVLRQSRRERSRRRPPLSASNEKRAAEAPQRGMRRVTTQEERIPRTSSWRRGRFERRTSPSGRRCLSRSQRRARSRTPRLDGGKRRTGRRWRHTASRWRLRQRERPAHAGTKLSLPDQRQRRLWQQPGARRRRGAEAGNGGERGSRRWSGDSLAPRSREERRTASQGRASSCTLHVTDPSSAPSRLCCIPQVAMELRWSKEPWSSQRLERQNQKDRGPGHALEAGSEHAVGS